jgi:hypothetical protein
LGGPGLNEQHPHLGLDYVRPTEVANPKHEAQFAVATTHNGPVAELQCARSLFRPHHLEEDQSDLLDIR